MAVRVKEAVVLAAGEGKRMRPLTAERPKVMLPVGGVPVLERVVRMAAAAGIERVHLVVHYHREAIEAHFGDGAGFGVEVHYHDQGAPRGTGHALAAVAARPTDPFLVLSGDNLYGADDLAAFVSSPIDMDTVLLGAVAVDDPTKYGALETDDDRLVKIHEKSDRPPSDLVNAGIYRFPPDIFRHVEDLEPSPRGERELTDAIDRLAADGRVRVQTLSDWRDVGRPWDLLDVTEALLDQEAEDDTLWAQEGTVEDGVHLRGKVRIGPGAVIKSGTYIEGPVVIGPDAVIGPHAYIRGRTTIGTGCKVGAHTELKNSILMDGAKVPHLSYVGDSILGANVNLGAGTKVANLRHDKKNILVHTGPDERTDCGRYKFGVIFGDHVKTGINTSFNVGTVAGRGAGFAPGQSYSGHYEGDTIHRGGPPRKKT